MHVCRRSPRTWWRLKAWNTCKSVPPWKVFFIYSHSMATVWKLYFFEGSFIDHYPIQAQERPLRNPCQQIHKNWFETWTVEHCRENKFHRLSPGNTWRNNGPKIPNLVENFNTSTKLNEFLVDKCKKNHT